MRLSIITFCTLLFLAAWVLPGCKSTRDQSQVSANPNSSENRYEANWESLATHEKAPGWFEDAKLGIYFHWGPYSVPAFGSEWYPRWMYIADREGWGKGTFQYHEETYGHPSKFNYHDFIPMFTAEHFDPTEWAELFAKSGAQFAGPVAQHHDGFAMWDSEVNPWNAMDQGPKRDILGELFTELKAKDIKTIATFHHARTLQRNAHDSSNWQASTSHFPYHPAYATSTSDPKLRYLYGNLPADEFHNYWLAEVNEVVDKYAPDIIWFDSWLHLIPEPHRQQMVAHHFNQGAKRQQEVLVAYKQEDLPRDVGVLDIEQGGMKELSPDVWLTDITLSWNSWCYVQNQRYKPAGLLLKNMIDVWSKRGVVLLNVSPRSDGVIPDEQRAVLADLGVWLQQHERAIYGTRAHHVYGYGTAAIKDGHHGG
ncbi:MAG: alpha-L-fucosidase, partial [Bacteroidota bacterium]